MCFADIIVNLALGLAIAGGVMLVIGHLDDLSTAADERRAAARWASRRTVDTGFKTPV